MRNDFRSRRQDWGVFVAGLCAALFLALGCEKSTDVGGPGATVNGESRTDNTFVLTLPTGEVDITQGETKQVTIGIDRGSAFTDSVEVTLTAASDAINVEPNTLTLAAGDTSVDVTLTAKPDAIVGPTTISLVGSPPTGKSVNGSIQVRVNERTE